MKRFLRRTMLLMLALTVSGNGLAETFAAKMRSQHDCVSSMQPGAHAGHATCCDHGAVKNALLHTDDKVCGAAHNCQSAGLYQIGMPPPAMRVFFASIATVFSPIKPHFPSEKIAPLWRPPRLS